MKNLSIVIAVVACVSGLSAWAQNEPATSQPDAPVPDPVRTVSGEYPTLASAALAHACLAELPDGVLLKAGELTVTQKDIDLQVAEAPKGVQEQLRKNAFFLLEQVATRQLLLVEARAATAKAGLDAGRSTEQELLQAFFEKLTAGVKVTDAEVADFFQQNQDLFAGQKLDDVQSAIGEYLRQQKQQEWMDRYVQGLGQRTVIEVAGPWLKRQAALAMDNPVDKARTSGKPSLVDFGAQGCIPCDKLAPILEAMKTKFDGKANVFFVSVREEQVLASRYGVQTIPVQIFFDASGKEVFRHTGFCPQEELEKKLAEMGVK